MLAKIYEKLTGRCWHNYCVVLDKGDGYKCYKCNKIKRK